MHFKLAGKLAKDFDYLFLEDLNLKEMQKLWGRKVSDLGFSEFVSILHYQASKTGCTVHHIDRWFPPSKMCGVCGATHNRDELAANNVLREGASSLELGVLVRLRQSLFDFRIPIALALGVRQKG